MNVHESLARRLFTPADQERFAKATGDVNPMHVDAIAARRTQAGAPVVHGMHLVLWALETLVESGRLRGAIASVDASFERFVYVGSEVALRVVSETEKALKAELTVDGTKVTALSAGYHLRAAREPVVPRAVPAAPGDSWPRKLDIAEIRNLTGRLALPLGEAAAPLFPRISANAGAGRIEAIARLSTLVGMHCPGLHSIFSAVRIDFAEAGGEASLAFEVVSVDERIRMIELAACGGGVVAAVTAFVRQAPVVQASLASLSGLLKETEFDGATALVIGGSRGIGALVARAVAAGGGRVVVTYVSGEADAREIAAEIGPQRCRVLRFDALDDAGTQLAGLEWDVTALYYFATPKIFRQKGAGYSPALFAEFCRYYVDGFYAACLAIRERGARELTAFYPSSVALDERPRDLTEYTMAKAAGEVLCADMNRALGGLRVLVRRLPRLPTDQTATVMPIPNEDPIAVMLPLLREMHAPL